MPTSSRPRTVLSTRPHADPRVERVLQFYENLQASDLTTLDRVYEEQARFKDPFNEVQGIPAIRHIFAHMFEALQAPRFVMLDVMAEGDQCMLTWDFHFGRGGKLWLIHGASHLRFGADGRVSLHRDYWDAAEELYEKLPVVGALMRWLKRQAGS